MNKRQNKFFLKVETYTAAIGTAKASSAVLLRSGRRMAISVGGRSLPVALVAMAVAHQPPHRTGQPPASTRSDSAGIYIFLGKLSLQLLACR